jgi:hypothetical protein
MNLREAASAVIDRYISEGDENRKVTLKASDLQDVSIKGMRAASREERLAGRKTGTQRHRDRRDEPRGRTKQRIKAGDYER